jgi:hypothetical protein
MRATNSRMKALAAGRMIEEAITRCSKRSHSDARGLAIHILFSSCRVAGLSM